MDQGTTTEAERYTYSAKWSEEDDVWVARVEEFDLLRAHGDTEQEALIELKCVVQFVIEDLREGGEAIPEPKKG